MNSERLSNLTEAVENIVKHFGYPPVTSKIVDAMGTYFVLKTSELHNLDRMFGTLLTRGFKRIESDIAESYIKEVDMVGCVTITRRNDKPFEICVGVSV
jgi:hypothetical protein